MKTSYTLSEWPPMPCLRTCIAMLVSVLITAGCTRASGQVLDQRISVRLHEVPLESALKKLESTANVKFFYSPDQLRVTEPISVEVVDRPLRDVLEGLLRPLKISWRVHEKERAITLKRQADGADEGDHSSSSEPVDTVSQRQPVRGHITDAGTGLPMAGINILIKGTTAGTTTDSEGNFTIYASADDVLVFTFIGYKTLELQPGGRSSLTLRMEEDLSALDEVVVYASGYHEISPERSTGSYSHLGKELLERNVGSDILSRLEGLTPALLIDRRSGQPFLNIRGRSTILANDQPLIVVDNFPYDGDLSTINPNDVESVTILKDAAAASIWGVRAGNGVIVITTKKGTPNRPMEVQVNSNVTVGEKPDLFYQSRMSTSDFIDVEKMLFDKGYFDGEIADPRVPPLSPVVEILLRKRNGEISEDEAQQQLDALRTRDVRRDISQYFYRAGVNQRHAVNVTGGSDRHSYFFSVGYDAAQDARVGNGNQRISMSAQNTFNPIKPLSVHLGLGYTQSVATWDNTAADLRMGGRNLYPYAALADENGNPLPIPRDFRSDFTATAEEKGFLNWQFKPLEETDFADNENNSRNIRAVANIQYNLTKELSVEGKYQYEAQAGTSHVFNPVESYYARDFINRFSVLDGTTVVDRNIPTGGILTYTHDNLSAQNVRADITFDKSIHQHAISALAGIEVREVKTEGYSNRFYGYDPTLGSSSSVNYKEAYRTFPSNTFSTIPDLNGVDGTIDRFRSFFANAAYTYDNRYTLSLSGRIDQSNLFGVKSNQRSAPLWSAGFKWALHREHFLNSRLFSSLNLRATYGFNGNIDQSVTAFTTARFVTATYSRREAARVVNPPNPELRWERAGMLNIGLDFATTENRVSGSIEYYKKNCIDIIGQAPMDPTTGMTSFKGNIAELQTRGVDASVSTKILKGDLKWQADLLFSYALDKVAKYDLQQTSIASYFHDGSLDRSPLQYTPVEGRPLFAVYSFPSAGLDPDNGDPRGYVNGEPSSDYAGITSRATIDSLYYHGPALPPVFGSIRNTLAYHGWSLSLNITYRLGYYFRRPSISYSSLFSLYDSHGDYSKRWTKPGDEAHTVVPSMVYPADPSRDAFYSRTDDLVERADNLRLQDVRISYDFPQMRIGSLWLTRLQLYAYIVNLGILWRANDAAIDPDFPSMPLPRMYTFGVKAQF